MKKDELKAIRAQFWADCYKLNGLEFADKEFAEFDKRFREINVVPEHDFVGLMMKQKEESINKRFDATITDDLLKRHGWTLCELSKTWTKISTDGHLFRLLGNRLYDANSRLLHPNVTTLGHLIQEMGDYAPKIFNDGSVESFDYAVLYLNLYRNVAEMLCDNKTKQLSPDELLRRWDSFRHKHKE